MRNQSKNVDVAFSPSGKWLAVGGGVWEKSGTLKIWDCLTWKLHASFKDEFTDQVRFVRFLSDETVTSASGKRVRRGNPNDGIDFYLWSIPDKKILVEKHLTNARGFANTLDYHPKDDLIVFNQWDPFGKVGVYRMTTLVKKMEFGTGRKLTSIHRFSPDGKRVLSCDGPTLVLSDVATGNEIARRVLDGVEIVNHACFSPNDKMILALTTRAQDQTQILQGDLSAALFKVSVGPAAEGFATFTPDSKSLAITNGDIIEILSVENMKTTKVLTKFKERVTSFCFNSDATMFAIASEKSVRVIDVKSGETLADLQ